MYSEKEKNMCLQRCGLDPNDYCLARYGLNLNDYIEKVNEYNALFFNYFDQVKECIESKKIEQNYLFEKYGCVVQNTYNDIALTYAEEEVNEILFLINEENYRILNEEDLLFIKEKILFPFKTQVFFITDGLNRTFNLDEIHEFKDTIPYVIGIFDEEDDRLIGEKYSKTNEELQQEQNIDEYMQTSLQHDIFSFEKERYDLVVKEYRKVKREKDEKETEIIEIICGNYAANRKSELIQNYIEYVDDLYDDKDIKHSTVHRISTRLEDCITRFPQWSEVNEKELLAFKEKVTFNYILILFHKYRLCRTVLWENKLLDAMVYYFRKQFNGEDYKLYISPKEFMRPSDTTSDCEVKVMRCYNNIIAYYYRYKMHFDRHQYQEVFDNANIEMTYERECQIINEKQQSLKEVYARIDKNETLLLHADPNDKDIIQKQIVTDQKKIDEIKKEIDAKYAKEIVASSMDVIFLLKEYITLKEDEAQETDELINIKKSIRIMEADIKNTIYSNSYILDFYREDRKRYNTSKISYGELQLKECEQDDYLQLLQFENQKLMKKSDEDETEKLNLLYELDEKDMAISELKNAKKRNMLLNEYYKFCLEALEHDNIESIMSKRNELLTDYELLSREDEEEIERVSKLISDIAVKNVTEEKKLTDIDSVLEMELGEAKRILPEKCYKTLYTAEFLYDVYVKNEDAKELMDYSCISALYYQALEGAYNQLIYSGYIKWIEERGVTKELSRCKKPKKEDKAYGYFPSESFSRYWTYKAKESCMYGDFIKLLEEANKDPSEVGHFNEYLKELWGGDWDRTKMSVFCEGLEKARTRRNDASHGGKNITKKGAETDKRIVLLEKRKQGLKDLIVKLCEFFI